MAFFDSFDQTTDNALNKGEDFIRNSEAYYELKLFQVITSSLSLMIKAALIGVCIIISMVLLAIALSIYLSDLLNNIVLGYLITSGVFILLALIVYGLRRKIENNMIKRLSVKFFKD